MNNKELMNTEEFEKMMKRLNEIAVYTSYNDTLYDDEDEDFVPWDEDYTERSLTNGMYFETLNKGNEHYLIIKTYEIKDKYYFNITTPKQFMTLLGVYKIFVCVMEEAYSSYINKCYDYYNEMFKLNIDYIYSILDDEKVQISIINFVNYINKFLYKVIKDDNNLIHLICDKLFEPLITQNTDEHKQLTHQTYNRNINLIITLFSYRPMKYMRKYFERNINKVIKSTVNDIDGMTYKLMIENTKLLRNLVKTYKHPFFNKLIKNKPDCYKDIEKQKLSLEVYINLLSNAIEQQKYTYSDKQYEDKENIHLYIETYNDLALDVLFKVNKMCRYNSYKDTFDKHKINPSEFMNLLNEYINNINFDYYNDYMYKYDKVYKYKLFEQYKKFVLMSIKHVSNECIENITDTIIGYINKHYTLTRKCFTHKDIYYTRVFILYSFEYVDKLNKHKQYDCEKRIMDKIIEISNDLFTNIDSLVDMNKLSKYDVFEFAQLQEHVEEGISKYMNRTSDDKHNQRENLNKEIKKKKQNKEIDECKNKSTFMLELIKLYNNHVPVYKETQDNKDKATNEVIKEKDNEETQEEENTNDDENMNDKEENISDDESYSSDDFNDIHLSDIDEEEYYSSDDD